MTLGIADEVQWAKELYLKLGIAPNNLVGLTAWALKEGGNFHNSAKFNPLNTTWKTIDSVGINSVHVQSYTSWDEGLTATVDTLHLSYYPAIIRALGGSDPEALSQAVAASPWGTGSFSAFIPEARSKVTGEKPGPAPAPEPGPTPSPVKPAFPQPAPKFPGRLFVFNAEHYEVGDDIREWQQVMKERGWTEMQNGVDGAYGPISHKVCEQFQQEKGLTVDGIVGPVTWAASWEKAL